MPAKNVLKIQIPESYYHVYARGGNKSKIFLDNNDYKHFASLLERYLGCKKVLSKTGVSYPNFHDNIELLAYCLMQNHFHMLIYQHEVPSLEKLMRSLMTSYSRYFNLKYKRTGPVFESRYKAVRIDSDPYLLHITRYIHLNPKRWESHKYSSLRYYRLSNEPDWLQTDKILSLFPSREEYITFVSDYKALRDSLEELKYQLAN